VEVFRAPQHVPAIVDSCIKLGIRRLWLQDGVVHEAAALRAQQASITNELIEVVSGASALE
jgi:predicted CoA-binding protein